MSAYETAYAVAESLASLWAAHKHRAFTHYLSSTFGFERPDLPCFERIYIAEIATGDAQRGRIGSEVNRWWVVDDAGLREEDVEHIDFASRDGFYLSPVLKFLVQPPYVAIGERLGPDLSCRKVGMIDSPAKGRAIKGVETIWRRSPAL